MSHGVSPDFIEFLTSVTILLLFTPGIPVKKNLTVRFIQSIRPPKEGVAVYWDTAISSFGLHVSRSGKMTWKLMYRVNGRLKNKKIGTYPMVSLADARHEANQILLEASEGEDRFADTSTAVENPSFD
ncbi:MAG: DUF4102 domain-containing protein [SAR324 cluster bacterium]|nr:DUF4102 domain-containing protein [SAR324 cluster bacterium]